MTFENYYPYTPGEQDYTGLNADWPNRIVKVTDWQYLNGNPAGMKEHISTYGAVTACLDVYRDFYSYGSGVYRHVTGKNVGGHCVSLVGYDDAQSCWIAKNSWGTGWGDGGFVRIAYGQCRIESYQTCGIRGTTVRAWLPNQQILGLWSNEYDTNTYAYASDRGWLKLDIKDSPNLRPPDGDEAERLSTAAGTTAPQPLDTERLVVTESPAPAAGAPTLAPPSQEDGAVEAAEAVTATWRSGVNVTALWSINETRNMWMHVPNIGWKKLYTGVTASSRRCRPWQPRRVRPDGRSTSARRPTAWSTRSTSGSTCWSGA